MLTKPLLTQQKPAPQPIVRLLASSKGSKDYNQGLLAFRISVPSHLHCANITYM